MGELPWMYFSETTNAEEYSLQITRKKKDMPVEEYSKVVPREFVTFLKKMKALKFEDRPEYEKLRLMFQKLAKKSEIEYDGKYDWTEPVNTNLK